MKVQFLSAFACVLLAGAATAKAESKEQIQQIQITSDDKVTLTLVDEKQIPSEFSGSHDDAGVFVY